MFSMRFYFALIFFTTDIICASDEVDLFHNQIVNDYEKMNAYLLARKCNQVDSIIDHADSVFKITMASTYPNDFLDQMTRNQERLINDFKLYHWIKEAEIDESIRRGDLLKTERLLDGFSMIVTQDGHPMLGFDRMQNDPFIVTRREYINGCRKEKILNEIGKDSVKLFYRSFALNACRIKIDIDSSNYNVFFGLYVKDKDLLNNAIVGNRNIFLLPSFCKDGDSSKKGSNYNVEKKAALSCDSNEKKISIGFNELNSMFASATPLSEVICVDKHKVMQDSFIRIMGHDYSFHRNSNLFYKCGDNCYEETVRIDEAKLYCKKQGKRLLNEYEYMKIIEDKSNMSMMDNDKNEYEWVEFPIGLIKAPINNTPWLFLNPSNAKEKIFFTEDKSNTLQLGLAWKNVGFRCVKDKELILKDTIVLHDLR